MATATVEQIPEGYVPPTFEPPAPGAADAAPSLATKLYRIMGDIEAVPKLGHNKDQNYEYVRASEISRAVGKLLMSGPKLVPGFVILARLVGIVPPMLIDARHWWPRKPKKKAN